MNFFRGLTFLGLCGLCLSSLWGQGRGGGGVRTVRAIETSAVRLSPIYDTLSFLGRVVPERSERHMSEIAGYVQKVYAVAGQKVRKGDLLFSVLADKEIGGRTYKPQIIRAHLSGVVAFNEIAEGAYVNAFKESMEIASQDKWLIRTFASDKDRDIPPPLRFYLEVGASCWGQPVLPVSTSFRSYLPLCPRVCIKNRKKEVLCQ